MAIQDQLSLGITFSLPVLPIFSLQDTTDYAGEGIDLADVLVDFTISNALGVVYTNSSWVTPDITRADTDTFNTVNIPLTSGVPIAGDYTFQMTVKVAGAVQPGTYVYTKTVTYNYERPTVEISFNNNPYFALLSATDVTQYLVNGIYPTLDRTFTLIYPDVYELDNIETAAGYIAVGAPFYLDGTYRSTLVNNLTYTYPDYIVIDTITGSNTIEVADTVDIKSIYCCLNKLNNKINSYATTNTTKYAEDVAIFNLAQAKYVLFDQAVRLGQYTNADALIQQIYDITGCTKGCTCGNLTQTSIHAYVQPLAGGSGTVTSVALSMPNIFTVTGSPITSNGTLGVSLASQSQNLVFASPNGSSGLPTFRALVASDLPSLSGIYFQQGGNSFSAGAVLGTTDNNDLFFIANSSNKLIIRSSTGNVELSNNLKLPTTSSTAGIIYQGSSTILHTYGTENLFIGKDTGNFSTTGVGGNIFIGSGVGTNLGTGIKNILIGYGLNLPLSTTSNYMSLGNIIFATGIDGTGSTISNALVGIGNKTPTKLLSLGTAGSVTGSFIFTDAHSYLTNSFTDPDMLYYLADSGHAGFNFQFYMQSVKTTAVTQMRTLNDNSVGISVQTYGTAYSDSNVWKKNRSVITCDAADGLHFYKTATNKPIDFWIGSNETTATKIMELLDGTNPLKVYSGATQILGLDTTGLGLFEAASAPSPYSLWIDKRVAAVPVYVLFSGTNGTSVGINGTSKNLFLEQTSSSLSSILTSATALKLLPNSGASTGEVIIDGTGFVVNTSTTGAVATSTLHTRGSLGLKTNVSSAGTLTLSTHTVYVFSGTTATWSLPTIGTTDRTYFIKNRGSGNLTIDVVGGGTTIYTTTAVTSVIIAAGSSAFFSDDGTYWIQQ